jgi:hypothetical protein
MRSSGLAATLALSLALLPASLCAQQLGYSSGLAIPLIAQTPSYASQIFIHNPGAGEVRIGLTYVDATGSATPGPVSCNTVPVPGGNVVQTSLGAVCPLIAGSNFGVLVASPGFLVALYSRIQTPSGNGFSVEGMMDSCCQGIREVVGLGRQAAAPGYQSNCFIFNEEQRSGRIVVTLVGGAGQAIVTQIVNLAPGEFVRMLDVFAALGAPAGDYGNVRGTSDGRSRHRTRNA